MAAPHVLVITPSMHERFWAKVDKEGPIAPRMKTQCWLWIAGRGGQYGTFQVKLADGRFVSEMAHRIAWALTHGRLPLSPAFVCHTCDVPLCVRPSHLWLGDASSNMADRDAKGRQAKGKATVPASRPRGEDHYATEIDEDDVRAIRQAHTSGVGQTALAIRYGLSQAAVWYIVKRKTWKHVKG